VQYHICIFNCFACSLAFVPEHFDDEVKKRKNSNKNEKKRISSSLVKLEITKQ
jgi:hypothetical protein